MSISSTEFTLYRNTPFVDFDNTFHFKSNQQRDIEMNRIFEKKEFTGDFNFIRDRLKLNVSAEYDKINYHNLRGYNYARFKTEGDNNTYYCFIQNITYVNEDISSIYFIIDTVMTFTQGDVLSNIFGVNVIRQHLTNEEYNFRLPMLKTNDDVIKTTTKKYVYQKRQHFISYTIVFQSSVDLKSDFGTRDDPKIETSTGGIVDDIVSPVDLYVCSADDFNDLMKNLSPFAWITQNIKVVLMIPSIFIDNTQLVSVKMKKPNDNITYLKTFKKGAMNKELVLNTVKFSYEELATIYGININNEEHLMRNEYTTLEIYDYAGQQILLDTALLDTNVGLELKALSVLGYHNEIRIYPKNYSTTDKEKNNKTSLDDKGTFLNNAIVINAFNDIPILIDNYDLALSKSANRRELANSKTTSGRIKNVLDNDSDIKDRFFDAMSLTSDLSATGMLNKFSSDRDYYRNQMAEFKDMQLESPTITSQTNSNSLAIKNGFYGVTVKMSAPNILEMNKVRKYYQSFGYEINEQGTNTDLIDSMSICNYLQFDGNWSLPNVDNVLMEQLRLQLAKGVKFWHYKDRNTFQQNILSNKREK